MPTLSRYNTPLNLGLVFLCYQFLMLTQWWAPFGWNSWGSRLIIPPVLSIGVLCILSIAYDTQEKGAKPLLFRKSLYPLWLSAAFSCLYVVSGYYSNTGELRIYSLYPKSCIECDKALHSLPKDKHAAFFENAPIYKQCSKDRLKRAPFL